jgi:RNA polymerase sigma-70 factor (ECF subfamily)
VDTAPDPAESREIAGEVSLAFLTLLERLGPEERAAFLLKEAFDYDYANIGQWLGHSEANCRQLVHRARERLRAGRPRFVVPRERHRHLLQRFMEASQRGDRAAITALLADDARMISDGGGKVTATLRPLLGAERIARLYWAVFQRNAVVPAQLGWVNGEPAILRFSNGRLQSLTLAVSDGERITELLTLMNPDKLSVTVTPPPASASLE